MQSLHEDELVRRSFVSFGWKNLAAAGPATVVGEKTFQKIPHRVPEPHQRGCNNGGCHFAATFTFG